MLVSRMHPAAGIAARVGLDVEIRYVYAVEGVRDTLLHLVQMGADQIAVVHKGVVYDVTPTDDGYTKRICERRHPLVDHLDLTGLM